MSANKPSATRPRNVRKPAVATDPGFRWGALNSLLLGIGIVATIAQLTMTWAYKHVSATEGSLMAFLTPVLNVILGVVVFGEKMHLTTVAGSALVLGCCGYVAFRERILRLAG